ncbi:transposase [Streptomyces sp. NBC_01023]|uniref:IS701 family transposase n=1 Tax=Streptomyces sp. NBC_01023 TaxID=2903724 RepID=UPI0038658983
MRADELVACRGRLEEFAGKVFAPLVRADQRVKGGLYLRGLLLDGRRKSMQPMAGRLGVDNQQLQQFMTSPTWPVNTVRAGVARRAVAVVRPQVWVVDDTGFPKDGTSSPGVARQHSATLGKVGNCQIGVRVQAASDTASCPLSWRLFLPSSWDKGRSCQPSGPLPHPRRRASLAEVAARAGHARCN